MGHCKVPGCGGTTEYEDSAQVVLCTTCGTVATQDIFTHQYDGELLGSSLYFGPTTLRSLRRVGGVLAGQPSKEDKDRRNTVAMHQYITGLLTKLGCSGLAARAQSLFDQSRVRGEYRWGKKSILVAGACTLVVLRENRKGVMMSHLASLMSVSSHALRRIFMHLTTILGLQVSPFDPLSLLPGLQSHLATLMASPTGSLPQSIVKIVKPLPPALVLQLATSLTTVLNHLDTFSSPDISALPTVCASFILALEGQAASSLPSYTTLAEEMAKFAGTPKNLVVERYRDISKLVGEWMEEVPWISGANHPDNRLGRKRRKLSHRDVIAMGLKDVVQFQEDIAGAQSTKTGSPVTVSLEVLEGEDMRDSIEESLPAVGQKRKRSESVDSSVSSGYLRITRTRRPRPLTPLDRASLALLSPAHSLTSNPPLSSWSISDLEALQVQILTSSAFPSGSLPTRLQQLAALRGGEEKIKDDELFEEGELDDLFRADEEVGKLRQILGWDESDSSIDHEQPADDFIRQEFDQDLAGLMDWDNTEFTKEIKTYIEVTEQVLGEWREASPAGLPNIEEGDKSD